jgi:hypothetical protein
MYCRNVQILFSHGQFANTAYSVKDLRLDTPVSLPVFITLVLVWFMVLNYIFLF